MPRWIASPVLGLCCLLAGGPGVTIPGVVAVGIMSCAVAGSGGTRARAEMLSSGVFSDQDEQNAANALDPSSVPVVSPFAGIRPPDTRIAHSIMVPADPVVANVEGHPILLSDLGDAVQSLPEQLRKMPFEVIYPTLLDRMVDHEALVLLARREKLDDDPKVKREIEAATARVLEGALLERKAVPQVTDTAIQARYARDYANRPAIEEVHARHILVGSEAEAKRLIGELNKGADFATLARRFSKDPDNEHGGDVGFFRHDQVWPGFANLAFTLKPGEIAQAPIFNEFGWHVVQVLARRTVPLPSLVQAQDAIRKQLLEEAVRRVVAEAREGLRVHKFSLNGAPIYDPAAAATNGERLRQDGRTPGTNDEPAAAAPATGSGPRPQTPGAPQKPAGP
jgi:peptidyl-prolyl cis-trans isomerase C